ncbi:LamG domain-containing protein [Streptomyces polyrhachis]|uniref:LamG domain-containing protein n=1 Tax=Streptomyces polyrhachis TaxID=1282885 RepID=A0ABW2GGB0_9ACTN
MGPIAMQGAASAASLTSAPTELSASALAADSGERVEVVTLRDESAQTFANPDGTFTLEQATVPQRVKASDGSWVEPDATLVKRSDGRIGPKAAVVDVSFSPGGSGEGMLRLAKGGQSMALAWPQVLPEPVLDGATATYPEVWDGVDLQLTATVEGYREVLVVKSAQAAANPALEQIRFEASMEGLELQPGAGGGVRAVDGDGNALFKGAAAVMWDSSGPDASDAAGVSGMTTQMTSVVPVQDEPEPVAETVPGEGDETAVMPVKVAADSLEVKPDLSLLRGTDTAYPVLVDPAIGLSLSERTVLSSDGDKFYDFNGDYGVGNCSQAGPYYCGSNYTNRMYFEFSPTGLSGKYVLDATFRAYETWSFDCNAHWVDLERTDNIGEGTRWPGPPQLDQMGDRYVSAGRGGECSPSQPDSWIEFNDNPEETDENLKSTVRSFADGKISRLTLMLRAKDEGDASAWKRFDDNAVLSVTYVAKPGVPTSVGLIPGSGTTAYCKTSSSDPLVVTRLDPLVQARVQTLVQPASGEDKGNLQAEYIVERSDTDQPGTAWHSVWSGHRPETGWVEDGTLMLQRMNERADGGLYRYKARTQSNTSFNGSAVNLFSSYSSWCYFRVDVTAPKAPQITSLSPYTECTATACAGNGGPGTKGTFSFKPNTADTDVIAYRWRLLTSSAAKEISGDNPSSSTDDVHVVESQEVVPGTAGEQVLTVEAKDVRQRWGTPAEYHFKVKPGAGAVGRWHFTDDTPADAPAKLTKDTATEGLRHDATLSTAWSTFSTLGRRGNPDDSLWLDSSDPAAQGYAATSTPPINTRDSFTISAWVNMSDASINRTVLTAPGSATNAFTLYYSTAYKAWVFNRTDKDQAAPVYIRSIAERQNPPLNVWTHLAGVFDTKGDSDKSNDTIQLFVNGRPQGQPVKLSASASTYEPWISNMGMRWGPSIDSGIGGAYFRGRIDETAVWQRALTVDEIHQEAALTEDSAPLTELVAHWNAATSSGTTIKQSSGYPAAPAMTLSPSGAVIDEVNNNVTFDGAAGYARATGPVVDETDSFTVTARVELDSVKWAAKPVGYQAIVAGQRAGTAGESSWAIWAEKDANGIYWCFGRSAVDSTGKLIKSARIETREFAELDTWVQVTGVFDAHQLDATQSTDKYGVSHLYVGEYDEPQGDTAGFDAIQQGSGDISAGRGTSGSTTGRYLPGGLEEIRVWSGAMDVNQVYAKIIAPPPN